MGCLGKVIEKVQSEDDDCARPLDAFYAKGDALGKTQMTS